jgi:hypothetical protein
MLKSLAAVLFSVFCALKGVSYLLTQPCFKIGPRLGFGSGSGLASALYRSTKKPAIISFVRYTGAGHRQHRPGDGEDDGAGPRPRHHLQQPADPLCQGQDRQGHRGQS